jgi:mRNA-degrading endonuclease YafQ of YafQ-DinJ toxin-antitoxin module
MSNIKFFVTTDLFWETLGEYAGHALFPLMRKKIKDCVHRKLQNPNFRNARDKPFDVDPRLAGIWHCKLSEEIDAVLFYKIHGDTLFLTMIGSHHSYPADGKNSAKATPLAEKNRNAVAAGHVDYPARKSLKWSRPKDLIGNPLLEEIDREELCSIRDALRVENDEATIFRDLFGKDIMDSSEEEFDGWMREIVVAHIEIERALRRIDMSAISRRDRREISSLAPELEIDPEEILHRDGQGFTIELFVEAVKSGIDAQDRMSRGAQKVARIVEDFEGDPTENAQRLLTLARRLVVDLSRKLDFADSASHEIERLLVLAEVVLSDPDCAEMQTYASSRSAGYR